MLKRTTQLPITRAGWAPPGSAYLRLVEAAVLVGVMGHFAALLIGMIVF